MRRSILQTPQARQDLWEIAAYLAQDRLAVAMRFLQAAENTYNQILKNPTLDSVSEFSSPLLLGIRRWRIKGFTNYLIFYRSTTTEIEIIRVLHGAHDIEAIFTPETAPDD